MWQINVGAYVRMDKKLKEENIEMMAAFTLD